MSRTLTCWAAGNAEQRIYEIRPGGIPSVDPAASSMVETLTNLVEDQRPDADKYKGIHRFPPAGYRPDYLGLRRRIILPPPAPVWADQLWR